MPELQQALHGEKLSKPHFLISFDDGLREVHDAAAPILAEHGLIAMVFINPTFIGNRDMMYGLKASVLAESGHGEALEISYEHRERLDSSLDWRQYLASHPPYMDLDHLRSLRQQGFIIGAHSMDHPPYSHIPLSEQLEQTQDSISFVSTHFDPRLKLFAFPFTDDGVSMTFFNSLTDAVDATFGSAGLKADTAPNHFQRIPMEDYPGNAASIIRFEFGAASIRKLIGRNRIPRP
jgi:peptidoglycan/xylan/chitin deacetylase (PgdA/CDA1 family)